MRGMAVMYERARDGLDFSSASLADSPASLRPGARYFRPPLISLTFWMTSKRRGRPGTPCALRGGETARQIVPVERLSSATTRFVSSGSRPRSTHSTLV